MALSDLTASAVLKAIEEFDRLGRDAFLKKYGFGKARDFVLQRSGHSYDSKAIAGAAHGYLPGRTALTWRQFSGGEATVEKRLEALGFTIVSNSREPPPFPGTVLTNEEIGRRFAVGNMGAGGRAALSGKTLKDMGYDRVYNLGGFKDWADSGGAVEKVGEPE